MAGPPARSSSLTPVSLPCAVKGAVTRLLLSSIFGLGPRRLYSAPKDSADGSQEVWMTIGSGQAPRRSSGSLEPAAPVGWLVSPPPPPVQAPRRRNKDTATAAS